MGADGTISARLVSAAPVFLAATIAVAIYVVGRSITPDYATSLFGSVGPDTLQLKSWLATGVLAIAGLQLVLALWIYGRLPVAEAAPRPVPVVHRLAGGALILLTLPIAYHCMLAYGVQTFDTRVAIHSIAGAALYGALAAKILVVRSRRLAGWALPVAGAILVSLVVVLWYTSALWYFNNFSVPLLK